MPYEPFMGEIMYFAGPTPPKNWVRCDGQLMNINSNQALFALLGTTYGGNGVSTFGLPDLRGRAIMGSGTLPQGAKTGSESYTLQTAEMPLHNHALSESNGAGTTSIPATGLALGQGSGVDGDGNDFTVQMFSSSNVVNTFAAGNAISTQGSGQGHENRQPYIALTPCIALVGYFPSRN